MIGRIELVTPAIRDRVEKIATEEKEQPDAALADFAALGRFREAIILNAISQQYPNYAALQEFAHSRCVGYYQPQ